MEKTVLLTGANGFLGYHLVRELLQRQYAVRALVRPGNSGNRLTDLPVERYEGDVRQAGTLARAADGCQAIIHAAALAQVNPARNREVWAVNQTGTENVLQAARHAGVQRLIYVGTANVFGFGTRENPGDETRPFAGGRYGLDYIDSKRAATQSVEKAIHDWGLPAITVHPTFMLGAFDTRPTSGAMLLELYRGRVVGYPAGGKNYVHVRDVAVATVNALSQGRIGEAYILGNQNLSYQEAFTLMADVMQVAPPRWAIPPGIAQLYGYGCDAWANLTGRPTRLNAAMVAVANDGHYFSARKAIAKLALPQTPVVQAIREAFEWFRQNKYVG
ncbi:NAD-dependent epimerase/dehydratase family protein [Spirosoma areae]